jgi:hypothetical protein
MVRTDGYISCLAPLESSMEAANALGRKDRSWHRYELGSLVSQVLA